jgi:hypothetical protein
MTRNPVLLSAIICIGLSITSCASLPFKDAEARTRLEESEKKITELSMTIQSLTTTVAGYRQDLANIETTYANARSYYEELAVAAGYKDPAEFMRNLNEVKRISLETLEGYRKAYQDIEQGRAELQSRLTTSLANYDEKTRQALQQLDSSIAVAQNSLAVSMLGLQKQAELLEKAYNDRVNLAMQNLDSTVNSARNSLSLSIVGMQEQLSVFQKSMDNQMLGFQNQMMGFRDTTTTSLKTSRDALELQFSGLKTLVDGYQKELAAMQLTIAKLGQALQNSGRDISQSASRP